MYYIYIVRCVDGSHYTGIARYLCRRMREHAEKRPNCAKYTRSHPIEALVGLWRTDDRVSAMRIEYAIKQLHREQKLALIGNPRSITLLAPEEQVTAVTGVTLAMCLSGEFKEK